MSMFAAIVGVVSGASSSSGGGSTDIVANWTDLTKTGAGSVTGNTQTISFSGGGTRQLQVSFPEIEGILMYSKNSGIYDGLAPDELISVVTTDTITFRYVGVAYSENFTVTISDFTLGGTIDTFTVSFTV